MDRAGQEIARRTTEKPPVRVVVTGGGTIAPIDDVRFLANVSSGRFSAEITEECLRRSAHVWHVHAPSAVLPFARNGKVDLDAEDFRAELERVSQLRAEWQNLAPRLRLRPFHGGTVADYATTLRAVVDESHPDVIILAMAVSDFEPDRVSGKLDSARSEFSLWMRPTPKIIQSVRDWSPTSLLVGFKLLSGVDEPTLIATAQDALIKNRADVIVANDLQTVHRPNHTIHLVRSEGRVETIGPGGSPAKGLVERILCWAEERAESRKEKTP